MNYLAIAADYDGTLATDGKVDAATLAALQRYQQLGGGLLLVTGRELADLQTVFSELSLFDQVVAENGGVLYSPATEQKQLLAEPPPAELIAALHQRQVTPLRVGDVILAPWRPHRETVMRVLQEMTLGYQVILNKRAVMVLPEGVNKASGLQAALTNLGISAERVVGIGDAENDWPLLEHCGLGVAVENALDSLKVQADRVMTRPRGAGVQELIELIVSGAL